MANKVAPSYTTKCDEHINEKLSKWIYKLDRIQDRHFDHKKINNGDVDNNVLHRISSWLYYLSTNYKKHDNICVVDSVNIVNNSPTKVLVAINKGTLSGEYIKQNLRFCLTAMNEHTTAEDIHRFGFQSGYEKESNKLKNFNAVKRDKEGLYYVTKNTCFYLSCEVSEIFEEIDHYLFVAEIVESKFIDEKSEQMSYAYYSKNIKPNLIKNWGVRYCCDVCGYIHPNKSIPDECPICGNDKTHFYPYDGKEEK